MNSFPCKGKAAISVLLFLTLSCSAPLLNRDTTTSKAVKATITNKVFYEHIPSASGLEVVGESIFIIGDDSPYLYRLDRGFNLTGQTALADTSGFTSGRVAKKDKMDLESMASFQKNGKDHLLILGSGASEARMKAFIVEVDGSSGLLGEVMSYSLSKFYSMLQENIEVVGTGLLNIEGAAVENGRLYLLQRAVQSEQNMILSYDFDAFLEHLEMDKDVPNPIIKAFQLPLLNGSQAGFSGAVVFDSKLFYTASVENTTDAIADGEVLGSYVGFIELTELAHSADKFLSPRHALLTYADGSPYIGKAESIVVSKGDSSELYKVLIVSDDDQGHSELLEVDFSLK